ncbi:manganese-dependent inorganic pyrophosphatase [Vagococcus lutrae]|uniref:Probable manganese-dependent inorganic pyrophosphatase n=1 Tax=Vagococcus lutrae LBD1 TaxID=1408226 RepID=V6Q613_9ENTE|nr:manganese-dependent inorganic pyrophosphatase [Vagococcus lutrae]EST90671.1 manganese-dependent inorganic pyrophosphatase [Vagococcus lutrae LBD1]MDT2801060.1 manganese-dependent inorganic pyrophosphatase [Vagococcus lutrae]MDT2812295.1 manganese-dependent inorganic pyrophosphatase [Vagococcus lutrae]MDT2825231.1 manganese-dependent inorganic pyrophosphatase [Vagococcus lutrae]NKZ28147.1 manganese-dependent inorganic pyrophosphatase [Vagococcus lutrae]
MSTILIFGHKNPDTDTITSAISMSYLQNQLGLKTEAVALGAPNEETQFALDYFKVAAPRIIERASDETKQVMLVDHNEAQQSVDDIKDVEVLAVVDHHRIANFETANPLYYRAEPVGCTATILYKMYQENDIAIPKEIAGLMLSAIVSDTLLFKSPTCTHQDEKVAKLLAEIADVNLEEYGLEMLKAGTNLATKTDEEILDLDAKSFTMNGKIVRIGQVNTVDVAEVLARQASLEALMTEKNAKDGFDLFVLVITNILDSDSVVLAIGEEIAAVEKAFNVTLENHTALLPGVVSRKKQVVPQLTEAF